MKACVLLVVAGLASAAGEPVATAAGGLRSLAKLRTNGIALLGARITSCTQLSYSVTSGQPFGGLSCSGNTITIMAGRHNSEGVATSFKSGLTGGNMLCSDGVCGLGSTPDDLNFYVDMDITMTVNGEERTLKSFRVGQGHYFLHNNWWLGGPQCLSVGNKLGCNGTKADGTGVEVDFTQGSTDVIYVK